MGEVECTLCLTNGVLEKNVWCALNCGHGFHSACIERYIVALDEARTDYPPPNEGCPLCREGSVRSYIKLRLTLAQAEPIKIKKEPEDSFQEEKLLKYVCGKCVKTFTMKSNLTRHMKNQHENIKRFICPSTSCSKAFTRKDNLSRHLVRVHKS